SSQKNFWALITLEGNKIHRADVVHVTGNTYLFHFDVRKEYAPTVYASVSYTSGKQFYTREIPIQLRLEEKSLNIKVASDRSQYRPREPAHYQIHITDQAGKAVSSTFSFGLVDESIYAISPELAPDLY